MSYAIVAIKTTGGYAGDNGITEIAVVLHDGEKKESEFHTLIDPGIPIPAYVTSLNGITNEMLKGQPAFEKVAGTVFDLLKERVFVGHNVDFDYAFLKKHLSTYGYELNTVKLCTVRLCRKLFPGHAKYSLEVICRNLGIKLPNLRRAEADVAGITELFARLIQADTQKEIAQIAKELVPATAAPPAIKKTTKKKETKKAVEVPPSEPVIPVVAATPELKQEEQEIEQLDRPEQEELIQQQENQLEQEKHEEQKEQQKPQEDEKQQQELQGQQEQKESQKPQDLQEKSTQEKPEEQQEQKIQEQPENQEQNQQVEQEQPIQEEQQKEEEDNKSIEIPLNHEEIPAPITTDKPNRPLDLHDQVSQLPSLPGIYYFHNQTGKVIYVGKGNNIQQCVRAHFSDDDDEDNYLSKKKQPDFTKYITSVTHQVCGNELMALILENAEICRLWPEYNQGHKRFIHAYGLYSFTGNKGYIHLVIDKKKNHITPLRTFKNLREGCNLLNKLITKFDLDTGLCFISNSKAQKVGEEVEVYNERVLEAIDSLKQHPADFAIIDNAGHNNQQCCFLIEKGRFYGMGYVTEIPTITDLNLLKKSLTPYPDNDYIRDLIFQYAAKYPDKRIELR